MKKAMIIATVLAVIVLFAACGQNAMQAATTFSDSGSPTASSALPSSETKTEPTKTIRQDEVYVGLFEQDSLGALLPAAEANWVCAIIGRYSMDQPSWDNISDYTLVVNGVYYAYDSDSGILTKDDTHADMLSEADRAALNNAIGASDVVPEWNDGTKAVTEK